MLIFELTIKFIRHNQCHKLTSPDKPPTLLHNKPRTLGKIDIGNLIE